MLVNSSNVLYVVLFLILIVSVVQFGIEMMVMSMLNRIVAMLEKRTYSQSLKSLSMNGVSVTNEIETKDSMPGKRY